MFENKSNSKLSRKNDEKIKSNCSVDNINSAITFEKDKSINDIPNTKLQICQLSSSESRLSYDDESLRNSFSHYTSASLPAISSLDSYLVKNKANMFRNDIHIQENIKACTDEEDTLFNRLSEMKNPLSDSQHSLNEKNIKASQNDPEEEHEKDYLKEEMSESNVSEMKQFGEETIDLRLQLNDNKITNERNQVEIDICKKNESNSTTALSVNTRGSISRPTLADDSKLVKMSLLTNPMNIMQSNVQLLNKSRNFLNFITEKSTNIMEKALLPQHLAMKYNHISKSVESDSARFYTNNVSSLTDVIPRLYVNSANQATNQARNDMNYTIKQNYKSENNLDIVINNEKEINPSSCMKEDKIYDDKRYDSREQLLHNNNIENKVISDEKMYYVLKNNDDRLDCDVIDEQVKRDMSLRETDENKSFLQTDELCDDAYKEDSSGIDILDSNILKHDSLEHPSYLVLWEDYTSLKLEHSKLLDRMEYLKKFNRSNNSFQETETNALTTEAFILQVENLQRTVNQLTIDLNISLETQEALKKECAAVNKEKENMVMRYVTSEKQLIDTQR